MSRLVSVSVVALALALGAPAFSATNATLPGSVSTSLSDATSAADIAALVLANPDLAGTILAQAATLGIAAPAQVLNEAISPASSSKTISILVCAAAEARPVEVKLSAATAYSSAGGASWDDDLALIIATAAIDCSNSTDSVLTFANDLSTGGIETGGTAFPGGALPNLRAGGPPSFVELPSEAQTVPSPN